MGDPVMIKVMDLFHDSGMTLEQLGQAMGYAPEAARKSAWQLLKKTSDPQISMLRKFANAMGVPVQELVATSERETKTSSRKNRRKAMISATQPRTIEIGCDNGVTGYIFEFPDGKWGIRFCERQFRGAIIEELPPALRGTYPSADEAKNSISRHYKTMIASSKQTPR